MKEDNCFRREKKKCDTHGLFPGDRCMDCDRELMRRIKDEYERKLSDKERATIETMWRVAF